MEFNDIANVGATHCDCNPLHRHVHKCAYASATGTVSAWYESCITFSIKKQTGQRLVVDDAVAADDDDDAALPVDVAAAAAARRDCRSRRRRRLVELGVAAGAADVDT